MVGEESGFRCSLFGIDGVIFRFLDDDNRVDSDGRVRGRVVFFVRVVCGGCFY